MRRNVWTGPKPDKSKYQLKLDRRKAEAEPASEVDEVEVTEPKEPPEWEVTGIITKVLTKGSVFMETDGFKSERVYVRTDLFRNNTSPQEQDWVRCRVFRNDRGLRARAVLEHVPSTVRV